MKIGIFWYWNNQVLGISHSFENTDVDSIGIVDSSYTHVDYWSEIQREYNELRFFEYDEIPRGRTVFGGVSKSMLKKSRLNFDKIEKCK